VAKSRDPVSHHLHSRSERSADKLLSAADSSYKPTFDRWSRTDAPAHFSTTQSQGSRLYVGSLPRIEPQSAVDSTMQSLFADFQITAVSKIISPHPSKESEPGNHYYCFVDCASSEEADKAKDALDGMELPEWGGNLRVNKARDNKERKVFRDGNRDGGRDGGRESGREPGQQYGSGLGSGRWRGRAENQRGDVDEGGI